MVPLGIVALIGEVEYGEDPLICHAACRREDRDCRFCPMQRGLEFEDRSDEAKPPRADIDEVAYCDEITLLE